MTSFVHIDYPTEHPGVVRAQRVAATFKHLVRSLDTARAGASLLLAAIVSALVVVANQVVETWTEGHLLAAWIVMWAVAFAALGLLAVPVRRATAGLRARMRQWAVRRREAEQDQRLWDIALTDARVMADISRAMGADAARDVKAYY
ncbi:MAG TPA: hypothetical protein VLI46_15120 [Ramlibacter sp.]|nr:hypothetical protein [Ramlibacter sp.]